MASHRALKGTFHLLLTLTRSLPNTAQNQHTALEKCMRYNMMINLFNYYYRVYFFPA